MTIEALNAAIRSPALKSVARHWAEVRGSRRMPGWSDIRPSRVVRQLPIVWAYTYDRETDTFTARLAGDRIETIFGKAFRQTPLADIFPKSGFQDVFDRAKRVVSEPAVCRSEGLVLPQVNKFGYGERVMLPLASDGICADGILGCTEYRSTDGPYDDARPQTDEWFSL